MRFITSILLMLFITTAHAADFALKSTAFANNEKIPTLYSCDGKNTSPQLSWSNPPAQTKSFVLILTSPDWSAGKVHLWVLYNIPPTIKELPKNANINLPDGILVGSNYYYETGYRGPCPPDKNPHHYVFTLYALDTMLDLSPGAEPQEVLQKMDGHILKQTELTGIFSH